MREACGQDQALADIALDRFFALVEINMIAAFYVRVRRSGSCGVRRAVEAA
ncbi:hypothetical protein [Pelagibacterium luteolum]|uniref:Uncharacterized protein n=1 Tax=Pelagibacterium luteolum TaxID=440168 RepID=A0A1G8AHH9_9HYPH|nr:hypothetical protein [Pelagibacterium luteolum]SDH20408.1 hypothetical protein SAMN04487974_13022 [Pelagibacterium luteolum]